MKELDMNSEILEMAKNFSYEELASALYMKGEHDGYQKVTDKTKWREPVMAEKLGHIAHTKISAGAASNEYGSDAYDPINEVYAEYKSQAIDDKRLNNLLERDRGNGKKYVPLKVTGVYNGAYKQSALDAYAKVEHYFSVFYKETCVLIIKPKREIVIEQLITNNNTRKPGATTNLNSVTIDLGKKNTYDVVYKLEKFFL